ncbi:hypothetical protein D9613_009740 [Agrocybe pediades]|uniref:Uncharacterized protein n=1 Tax=Agrocybe pediades TaxID=84607 RepID=A0A8H4QVW1_9AGAR|nr:hypothetical protein D9613_009740 [Agrocybe pediades]
MAATQPSTSTTTSTSSTPFNLLTRNAFGLGAFASSSSSSSSPSTSHTTNSNSKSKSKSKKNNQKGLEEDDEDWYIPYNGPYEPAPGAGGEGRGRENRVGAGRRDSWGDLLDDYAPRASYGDDEVEDRYEYRHGAGTVVPTTMTTTNTTPSANAVRGTDAYRGNAPRRSTVSSSGSTANGIGESPVPRSQSHTRAHSRSRADESSNTNRISLASIFSLGLGGAGGGAGNRSSGTGSVRKVASSPLLSLARKNSNLSSGAKYNLVAVAESAGGAGKGGGRHRVSGSTGSAGVYSHSRSASHGQGQRQMEMMETISISASASASASSPTGTTTTMHEEDEGGDYSNTSYNHSNDHSNQYHQHHHLKLKLDARGKEDGAGSGKAQSQSPVSASLSSPATSHSHSHSNSHSNLPAHRTAKSGYNNTTNNKTYTKHNKPYYEGHSGYYHSHSREASTGTITSTTSSVSGAAAAIATLHTRTNETQTQTRNQAQPATAAQRTTQPTGQAQPSSQVIPQSQSQQPQPSSFLQAQTQPASSSAQSPAQAKHTQQQPRKEPHPYASPSISAYAYVFTRNAEGLPASSAGASTSKQQQQQQQQQATPFPVPSTSALTPANHASYSSPRLTFTHPKHQVQALKLDQQQKQQPEGSGQEQGQGHPAFVSPRLLGALGLGGDSGNGKEKAGGSRVSSPVDGANPNAGASGSRLRGGPDPVPLPRHRPAKGKEKEKEKEKESESERWLSAQTWCDALIFPRPRLRVKSAGASNSSSSLTGPTSPGGADPHLRGKDRGKGGWKWKGVVSPPATPVADDVGGGAGDYVGVKQDYGAREGNLREGGGKGKAPEMREGQAVMSRVLAHSRSLVDLSVRKGVSGGGVGMGVDVEAMPGGSGGGKGERPKSFAQDDLALLSPVPSLAHVLREGLLLQTERRQWQLQASKSFGNRHARSVSRTRTRALSGAARQKGKEKRGGKEKEKERENENETEKTSSLEYLAARACLGRQQDLTPGVVGVVGGEEYFSSSSSEKAQAHGRNESWSRTKSAMKVVAKSTSGVICGVSNADEVMSVVAEGTTMKAGRGADLEGALRKNDTKVIRLADPAGDGFGYGYGYRDDLQKRRLTLTPSPTFSAISESKIGIAIGTPPPPAGASSEESAGSSASGHGGYIPNHPYANGGLSFSHTVQHVGNDYVYHYAGAHPSVVNPFAPAPGTAVAAAYPTSSAPPPPPASDGTATEAPNNDNAYTTPKAPPAALPLHPYALADNRDSYIDANGLIGQFRVEGEGTPYASKMWAQLSPLGNAGVVREVVDEDLNKYSPFLMGRGVDQDHGDEQQQQEVEEEERRRKERRRVTVGTIRDTVGLGEMLVDAERRGEEEDEEGQEEEDRVVIRPDSEFGERDGLGGWVPERAYGREYEEYARRYGQEEEEEEEEEGEEIELPEFGPPTGSQGHHHAMHFLPVSASVSSTSASASALEADADADAHRPVDLQREGSKPSDPITIASSQLEYRSTSTPSYYRRFAMPQSTYSTASQQQQQHQSATAASSPLEYRTRASSSSSRVPFNHNPNSNAQPNSNDNDNNTTTSNNAYLSPQSHAHASASIDRAQSVSPMSTDTTDSSPQPLGSPNDLEAFQDLFYRPATQSVSGASVISGAGVRMGSSSGVGVGIGGGGGRTPKEPALPDTPFGTGMYGYRESEGDDGREGDGRVQTRSWSQSQSQSQSQREGQSRTRSLSQPRSAAAAEAAQEFLRLPAQSHIGGSGNNGSNPNPNPSSSSSRDRRRTGSTTLTSLARELSDEFERMAVEAAEADAAREAQGERGWDGRPVTFASASGASGYEYEFGEGDGERELGRDLGRESVESGSGRSRMEFVLASASASHLTSVVGSRVPSALAYEVSREREEGGGFEDGKEVQGRVAVEDGGYLSHPEEQDGYYQPRSADLSAYDQEDEGEELDPFDDFKFVPSGMLPHDIDGGAGAGTGGTSELDMEDMDMESSRASSELDFSREDERGLGLGDVLGGVEQREGEQTATYGSMGFGNVHNTELESPLEHAGYPEHELSSFPSRDDGTARLDQSSNSDIHGDGNMHLRRGVLADRGGQGVVGEQGGGGGGQPGERIVSYMTTTSTISRMSGLSDFPAPPGHAQ